MKGLINRSAKLSSQGKLLLLLSLLLLALSASFFLSRESFAGAPLVVSPPGRHLGKLRQNDKRDFSFNLMNHGREPLRILKVLHSCGCTEAKNTKEILQPGEEAQIKGSLNPESRTGEFGSTLTVIYRSGTDRDERKLEFLVGAKAVNSIMLPEQIELPNKILGITPEPYKFKVSLGEIAGDWDDLGVKSKLLKTKLTRTSGSSWQVEVTAPTGRMLGNERDDLVFELIRSKDSLVLERHALPVYWRTVSENFSLSPSVAYLHGDRPLKIKVDSLKNKVVHVVRLDMPEKASLKVNQIRDKGQLYLELQNFQAESGQNKKDSWSGKIHVVLGDQVVQEKLWISVVN